MSEITDVQFKIIFPALLLLFVFVLIFYVVSIAFLSISKNMPQPENLIDDPDQVFNRQTGSCGVFFDSSRVSVCPECSSFCIDKKCNCQQRGL